jgi:hypothetical protein
MKQMILPLKQYKIAHSLHEPVTKFVDQLVQKGRAKPAPVGCKFNSPLLAVPKKDEHGKMTGVRVCIDIRKVNEHLKNDDKFQLPLIPDLLSSLAHKRYYGEFDLSEAYLQFYSKKNRRSILLSPGMENNTCLLAHHLVSNIYLLISNAL